MVDLVALLIFLGGEVKSRLEQAGEIFGIAKARAQSHLTDRVELALQKVRCKIKLEVDYVSYRRDTVDLLEKLAEIYGISFEEMAEICLNNAYTLFGIVK